jgi:hypothetical protein
MTQKCLRSAVRRRFRGLTILELLVALTLASLLLGSVSGLLKILAARRNVLVEEARFVPWHRPLLERIQGDFANARQFELAPDRLRLVGYGGKDAAARWPTHRPTDVVYRLVNAANRTWLLREETLLDDQTNRNRQTELVCSGLTAIAMDLPGEKTRMPRRSGFVPDRFCLLLMSESPSTPPLELRYCP